MNTPETQKGYVVEGADGLEGPLEPCIMPRPVRVGPYSFEELAFLNRAKLERLNTEVNPPIVWVKNA